MSDGYQIGSGFTEGELRVSSWWVRHETHLRMFGYGSLTMFIVALWGFTFWSVMDAYIISYPRESRIPRVIAQNELAQGSLATAAPQPIQSSSVMLFAGTDDRQDFLTQISNPNAQWWVEFTYRFRGETQTTPSRVGYLLPASQRYLAEIGWKDKEGALNAAELEIQDLRWHRIDPLQVGKDYAAFASDRLRFRAEDAVYTSDLTIDKQRIGQTSFTLHNDSAYGFWSVHLTVVLTRLGTPIAVTTLTQRELKPGEARPLSINWFENISGVTQTDVSADVNILDPSVYLSSERF